MRILHAINQLSIGGAEALLVDLAVEQVRQGHRVEIVAAAGGEPTFHERLAAAGVPVHLATAGSAYDVRTLFRQAQCVADGGFDVVHGHLFPTLLWLALTRATRRATPPIVFTEHSPRNRRRRGFLRVADRAMYSMCDRVICISPAVEHDFSAWLPSLRDRLIVVPNAIDVARFPFAPPPRPAGPPKLLSVGRLHPAKGFDVLIAAIARLPGVELSIVGDGVLRDALMTQAREANVADRVHFLGLRRDVPALLRKADLYVQPSRYEGFGLAALEALAVGLPVVTSDAPGLADVVEGCAAVVPVGDTVALAEAIRATLAEADSARSARAEAGRKRAESYSLEPYARRITESYEAAIRSRAGAFARREGKA